MERKQGQDSFDERQGSTPPLILPEGETQFHVPGGPGRLPTQGSHGSVRAQLTHTARLIVEALRGGTRNAPPPAAAAGKAATAE